MLLLFDAQLRQDNGKSKPLFCQHGNRLIIYNTLPAACPVIHYLHNLLGSGAMPCTFPEVYSFFSKIISFSFALVILPRSSSPSSLVFLAPLKFITAILFPMQILWQMPTFCREICVVSKPKMIYHK